MKQAAAIAQDIAERLGLNETVVYIGMLMHDAGHSFGSHEGEETLKEIGKLLNAGYYHHNAKGVDIVLSEDIIEKFIDVIPGSKENRQLREKLEEEAWYFLDIIVGHDGEATNKDIERCQKDDKKYNSTREAVLDKVSNANRNNIYKCRVETLEGNIAKPADVIAYLKSDMLAAFRKKYITKFSDEYLKRFAELLFEKNGNKLSDSEKIEKVNEYIRKIQIDKLRETKRDVYNEESKEILDAVGGILENLKKENIDVFTYKEDIKTEEKVRTIVDNYITKYKAKKYYVEDKNFVEAEAHKIIDCVQKCLKMRNSVVEELMTKLQDELKEDYCQNTKEKMKEIDSRKDINDEEKKRLIASSMNFSPRVLEIMYGSEGIKNLNYKEYVQYTKKKYQTNALPKATYEAVKFFSKKIVDVGLIRDKFYDKSILAKISDEKVKEAMKIKTIDEREYDKEKKKIGINELKPIKRPIIYKIKRRFTNLFPTRKMYRNKYFKEFYAFTQRQGERFARTCEDVYYAIPNTVRELVKKAVNTNYEPNQYLKDIEKDKVFSVRKELQKRFGEYGGLAITAENLEKFIEEKIEEERTTNFPYNVAAEIAIKQLGGMNGRRIKEVLIKMGFTNRIKFNLQDKKNKEENTSVTRLITALSGENKRIDPKKVKELIKKYNRNEKRRGGPLFVIEDKKIEDEEIEK